MTAAGIHGVYFEVPVRDEDDPRLSSAYLEPMSPERTGEMGRALVVLRGISYTRPQSAISYK